MADEKRTYKTEAEKNEALTAIQDKPGGASSADFGEIDLISEAEVEEKEVVVGENLEEKPEEEVKKVEDKVEKKVEAEDGARKWVITEEMISEHDDEYFDGQKQRKFITQKNPGDLLKSYVGSEKNNHYLKTIRIPQAQEEGFNKAKTEYEPKLTALQTEIDALKAKPPEKVVEIQPKLVKTETLQKYNVAIEELNGITDEDSVEHTDKMKNVLLLSQKLREEEGTRHADDINNLKTEINKGVDERLTTYKTEQDQKEQKRTDEAKFVTDRNEQQVILDKVYNEIDVFAASAAAPPEVKTNQKFVDMQREALDFHNQLGEAYEGKPSSSFSQEGWTAVIQKAELDYLNGTPALIEKIKSIGINEPENYNAWKTLDGIDAMRTGWIRNKTTNQWEQRFNPNTGKRINLGDVKTAYNYYLDSTGKREEQTDAEKKIAAEAIIAAINKRDKGMVQLDDSKMTGEGEGQALTKAQAKEYLEKVYDIDFVRGEELRGNYEPLKKANAALVRLDAEPLEILIKK